MCAFLPARLNFPTYSFLAYERHKLLEMFFLPEFSFLSYWGVIVDD
jgi:hypothetical protein